MGLSDFTGAHLNGSTTFEACSLYASAFRSVTFDSVTFLDCDLEQAIFDGAVLRDVRFVNCRMAYGSFRGATLRQVEFSNCNLHGADLDYIEAHGVSYVGTNLWGARAAIGCQFYSGVFDQETCDRFLAIVARRHPNTETREILIRLAGKEFPLVDRLMKEVGDEAKAETEAPKALHAVCR